MSRLGKLGIRFPYMVAPMVGISHVAFRDLIRSYIPPGVDPLLFTEMLSTKRLPNEQLDQMEEGPLTAMGESFFIPQLLGNEEGFIRDSIHKLLPLHPWGFDINMGCPASQTLKHNWGVRLMGDKNYAAEVVSHTKKHSPYPVSVKLRAAQGQKFDLDYLLDFTGALENAGADWLTLHCRTQNQGHHGLADWDMVRNVTHKRKIPVVANGDIQTWEDAVQLVEKDGLDGAMVARAATARPWILWQIAYKLGNTEAPEGRTGLPPFTPEEEGAEYFRAILRFTCLVEKYFGDTEFALKKTIFYISQGSRWLWFGHPFFMGAKRMKNLVEMRDYVNDFSEKYPQPMVRSSHA